jgi:uncharacterized protein with ParB-like and HNH nuclease domain
MYSDNFCPKSVAEFLEVKHNFVIPSYQRGYRWEAKQVTDLLEDIKQFSKRDNTGSYYLQPLVVKPIIGKESTWEVLDGQQRLTTLKLLLMYLFENSLTGTEKRIYSDEMIFDLSYKNRPQLNFENPNPQDNIDSYYLTVAKKTIEDWFLNQLKNGEQVESSFKNCLLYSKNAIQVKFIWYVIDSTKQDIESIQVFNRLNKGKISLTSSELIKALFIMDCDLTSRGDTIYADQLSMEWNEIERKFQDDKYWYFISNQIDDNQTRIDILFDFVSQKHKDNEDKDYSYRMFQNLYDYCRSQERNDEFVELNPLWKNLDIKDMKSAWEYVIKTNDRMISWYEDNLYYHYVGFLIALSNQPLDIFRKLESAHLSLTDREWTKDDTKRELRKIIMESFKDGGQYLSIDGIDGLEYGSKFVKRLLLLFNVETSRQKNQRFAFDSYKKEQWDIEHIDSQNNSSLIEREDRLRWLKNVAFILDIESRLKERKATAIPLLESCKQIIPRYESGMNDVGDDYKEFGKKAQEYFSSGEQAIENKDIIGNLTLLDYKTNREYQDAPFPYKRYRIIEEDKAGNRFMPIGTRNVFLKYYSNSDTESSFIDSMRWSKPDLEGYMREIHHIIDPIFNVVVD